MNAEVRRPVYRGSQMVRALWFDCTLLGEAAARERVLADWASDARAWRLQGGYLLEWKRARRLQCELAPGLPLCEDDGVLASAPLLAHERTGIAAGSAVLVLGAAVQVTPLTPDLRVDPSLWLDLSGLPLCTALVMPRQPSAGFVSAAPSPAHDARAVLGEAVPPPSPERDKFLRRADKILRGREDGEDHGWRPARTGMAWQAVGIAALAAAALSGSVAGLLILPRLLLRRGGTAAGGAPAPRTRPAPAPAQGRFGAAMARLAMLTRLSTVLGWRQANYLRKMIRKFEQGDLDEALRHAIPLDSPTPAGRPALGVPGRRATLDIRRASASVAGIGLDDATVGYLRTTYQRSFDMLDRASRIDEAAFVLAELMNRRQEAVDYLERKGRIAQAAQLAETLELAPALLVRLHCLAGNVERAVLLARLTDGFGEAVAELERRKHPGAGALRLEWAQALAARGSLVEAAHTVWPLRDERERALAWLRSAEQAGGALGVQGLLSRLALDPQARHASRQAVEDLLFGPGEDLARQRVRACDCLLKLDVHNHTTRRIAGELWRRLLIDRGAQLNAVPAERLKSLQMLAADAALDADTPKHRLPALTAAIPLKERRVPLSLSFTERGLLPLEDVRRLPDGGYLLALGEGGVALTRDNGSELLRFPVPAHHLVLARGGRRALALARREKAVRVSRIDLLDRKAGDWFSARLDFWAEAYDGTSWSVVAEQRLMALDTAAAHQSVLWQVHDLPGRIVGFAQEAQVETMLLDTCDGVEQWRYTLPGRRLMGRDAIAVHQATFAVLPDCRNDRALRLDVRAHDPEAQTISLALPEGEGGTIARQWTDAPPRITLHDGLLLLRFGAADGWHCQLVDFNARMLADIVLPEAQGPQAGLHGGHLLAWDRCGRVVDVDMETSEVRMLTFG